LFSAASSMPRSLTVIGNLPLRTATVRMSVLAVVKL
jgi:hypothetical protein